MKVFVLILAICSSISFSHVANATLIEYTLTGMAYNNSDVDGTQCDLSGSVFFEESPVLTIVSDAQIEGIQGKCMQRGKNDIKHSPGNEYANPKACRM